MAEVKQFRLPDVGEGLTEADIVTWRVKPGDPVRVNQVIVEIETAKSLVELPSPYEGVVSGLLVGEGETVDVGTPIIEVDVAAGAGTGPAAAGEAGTTGEGPSADITPSGPSPAASPDAAAVVGGGGQGGSAAAGVVSAPAEETAREPGIEGSPAPKIERQAVLVGYGVKLGTTARRARKKGGAGGGSGAGRVPAASVSRPDVPGGNGATGVGDRPAAKPPVR